MLITPAKGRNLGPHLSCEGFLFVSVVEGCGVQPAFYKDFDKNVKFR
jgi:hypothetical protein